MLSDLVRVGTLMACNSIMWGVVGDRVIALGLLNTEVGILMKYYIDFKTDESVFLIGDEINFAAGFIAICYRHITSDV